MYFKFCKRLSDVVLVIIFLVISSPIFLITAAAIKLTSKGPVFFKQKRVGKDGNIFVMYKFRSMCVDAEARRKKLLAQSDVEGIFKMHDDPRITKVGKFIRKHSIDELPQFFNILKGDMSLVGPRPALIEEYKNYSSRDKERLAVKPGLTGLWQVSGRSTLSFAQMIDLDLQYIENRSLLYEFKIIYKTATQVLFSKDNGAF